MLSLDLTYPQLILLISLYVFYKELLKFGFKKFIQLLLRLRTRQIDPAHTQCYNEGERNST